MPRIKRVPLPPMAAVCLLISAGCALWSPSRAADAKMFKNADLVGMVYQQGNRPCPGVSVELLRAGTAEAVFQSHTGLNGRFVVPRLPRGEHRLRFTRKGYRTLTRAIRLIDPAHIFYTRMVSVEDLLLQAEEALDQDRWILAEELIAEAFQIAPRRGEVLFLQAVAAAKQGRVEEGRRILEEMRTTGFPLPLQKRGAVDP